MVSEKVIESIPNGQHIAALALIAGILGAFFAIADPDSKNSIDPIIIARHLLFWEDLH